MNKWQKGEVITHIPCPNENCLKRHPKVKLKRAISKGKVVVGGVFKCPGVKGDKSSHYLIIKVGQAGANTVFTPEEAKARGFDLEKKGQDDEVILLTKEEAIAQGLALTLQKPSAGERARVQTKRRMRQSERRRRDAQKKARFASSSRVRPPGSESPQKPKTKTNGRPESELISQPSDRTSVKGRPEPDLSSTEQLTIDIPGSTNAAPVGEETQLEVPAIKDAMGLETTRPSGRSAAATLDATVRILTPEEFDAESTLDEGDTLGMTAARAAEQNQGIKGQIKKGQVLVAEWAEAHCRVGSYWLEQVIGKGGEVVVTLATNIETGYRVAIKFVMLSWVDDEGLRKAGVARAARAFDFQKKLKSFNTPQVYGFNPNPEFPLGVFSVEELMEGEDFKIILSKKFRLLEAEVIEIALAVCEVVSQAHRCGFIHRDIKPENILLRNRESEGEEYKDRVMVFDWGIACSTKALRREHGTINPEELEGQSVDKAFSTADGRIIGTPHYMAPEQVTSSPVNELTDVYSLGATLYHMLVGATLFGGDTLAELIADVQGCVPKRAASQEEGISKKISDLVFSMVQKDPGSRPQSMEDVRGALEKIKAAKAKANEPSLFQKFWNKVT